MNINNILFSGGAKGSDAFWNALALKHNHKCVNYSFTGHKIYGVSKSTIKILSSELLAAADPILLKVSKSLKRGLGRNVYIKNLLRRNYYQIKESDALYGIVEKFKTKKINEFGGTAWAVSMFINENMGPAYIFDQDANKWFKYDRSLCTWGVITDPPRPKGKYTGIGTRNLIETGKAAILKLFENKT